MEAKEEERIHQEQVAKTPPREPEMNPQQLGNESHRTKYTNDDDGICDQSDRGRELMNPAKPKLSDMKTYSYGICRMNVWG